jgi:hypothetical protein
MTNLSDMLASAEKGAASIYHAVLATETSIVNLETTHPQVSVLIGQGVTYANALLARWGIPASVIEDDVVTALKALAAMDATVASVTPAQTAPAPPVIVAGIPAMLASGLVGTVEQAATAAGEVASVIVPAIAPEVAAGEALLGMAAAKL